jgi:hypothetical protein
LLALLPILRSDSPFTGRNVRLAAGAGALLLMNYLVNGLSHRTSGVYDRLPPGASHPGGGRLPLREPLLDLASVALSSPVLLVCLVALAVLGASIVIRHRRLWSDPFRWIVALAFLGLPLIHQYGTLALGCVLYVLARPHRRGFLLSAVRAWAGYLALSVAFWIAVAVSSAEAWQPGASLFVRSYRFVLALSSHFSIHSSVVLPFVRSVPLWSAVVALAIVAGLARHLGTTRASVSRFPLIVVVACLFLLPIFNTPYYSTRYSFFYFPIALSLLFTESFAAARWIEGRIPAGTPKLTSAAVLLPVVLLLASEDFSSRHLWAVASEDLNFRTGRFERFQDHWYRRSDFESPAAFVNERYRPGDVVVIDAVTASTHLEPPFVNFVSTDLGRFRGISREGGTTELWTNRPLLHDPEGLARLVPGRSTGRLWLIAAAERNPGGSFKTAAEVETFASEHGLDAVLEAVGSDGRLGVWRIERRADSDTG